MGWSRSRLRQQTRTYCITETYTFLAPQLTYVAYVHFTSENFARVAQDFKLAYVGAAPFWQGLGICFLLSGVAVSGLEYKERHEQTTNGLLGGVGMSFRDGVLTSGATSAATDAWYRAIDG